MIKTIASVITALTVLASAAHAHESEQAHTQPPWQAATGWPDRIVITLPGTPQTSFAVTWRTDAAVAETVAEIVEATSDARFDLDAERVPATTERLDVQQIEASGQVMDYTPNTGIPPAHFHSVIFENLKPDTIYAYRVKGAEDQWSPWLQTRTAAKEGPVSFLYFGDAQNALRSHWSRVVRAGFQEAPKADFILHAGDLVNIPSRDLEWAEWFDATGFIHGMIPAVPLAGNHEYDRMELPDGERQYFLSKMWRPQFTLPEEPTLHEDLQEVAFDLRYSEDVHLFILSTQSPRIQEQAAWLDRELTASDARWKIIGMHHPVFSSGSGRDSPGRRAALLPVINKHKVDLVLQGHDHTYARGAIAQRPERIAFKSRGDKIDTMFVNSVSGPKQYPFREDNWDAYVNEDVVLLRKAENTQFFQTITIDGSKLTYKAWTATGELYDDFVMNKGRRGVKKITRGAESTMDERAFSNTGPYPTR